MDHICLPMGQGIPASAKGLIRWREAHRPLDLQDIDEFMRAPTAPFLVREVEAADRLKHPKFDRERKGARRLVTVFRSGHRKLADEPAGWHALGNAIDAALDYLRACPSLSADAIYDGASGAIASGVAAPVLCRFVYLHAPGTTITLAHCGVRIYRDCRFDKLDLLGAYTLGAYQRLADRQRGFDVDRLSVMLDYLPYPSDLLTSARGKR